LAVQRIISHVDETFPKGAMQRPNTFAVDKESENIADFTSRVFSFLIKILKISKNLNAGRLITAKCWQATLL